MIVQNVVGTQKKEQSAEGRTQGSFHCDVTCYLTLEGYAKWEGEEKKKRKYVSVKVHVEGWRRGE